jgi:hypothetical protein
LKLPYILSKIDIQDICLEQKIIQVDIDYNNRFELVRGLFFIDPAQHFNIR